MKVTKKKVNPSTLSSTVKAHEDLYYICLNFKEMLSPMITESRSGTDLVSHQVVLPGIRSCLYSEHGTEAVGSPWCLGGMRHSSGCALPRVPHLPLAFPRSSGDWQPTTGTPLAFGCASLCPCTDWPWGGNVNLLENTFSYLLPAPPPLCFFSCSPL